MQVLVIVARQYNGHELWTALGVMQRAAIEFEVVSTDYVIEDEVTHQKNTITRTLDEVDPSEVQFLDGLMIVSGNMKDTELYWTHPKVQAIVAATSDTESPMPVAAICCSVPTIAPLTAGKRVSFFPLVRSRQRLSDAGAILSTLTISVDGNLVTAENQMASEIWAEEFVRLLQGEPSQLVQHESGFMPRGKERRPIPELERAKKGTR